MAQDGEAPPLVQSARIICTGFKFFQSPKSGQLFPAFLIQFRQIEEGELHYTYHWRTKLDFLLLKRFITKNNRGTRGGFSKSAYSNLCNQASWVRPCSGDLFPEKDAILKKIGHTYTDEDYHHGINYHPFMYRSLRKMDDFLIEVASIAEGSCADNNNLSCWSLFCRDEDSKSIVTLPMGKVNECLDQSCNKKIDDSVRRASKLGQYFTSETDASIVVRDVLGLCKKKSQDSQEIAGWSPFVFIEPSCGDGSIVTKLLHEFPLSFTYKKCLVLAYDIDENIIEKCRKEINMRLSPTQPMAVSIKCCDFLELSRKDLRNHISELIKVSPSELDRFQLTFIGNPPFTSGNGDGSSITRDLPSRFLTHSIVSLSASSVSFLLPVRYDKEVADTMTTLHQESNDSWCCDSKNLHLSKFKFQGKTVPQPSVLHTWSKR